MTLTKQARYAMMAILDIAKQLQISQHTVSAASIVKRQKIPLLYLKQILLLLKKNGLIVSVKGPGGGYRLTRPMEEISLLHIMKAVNEKTKMTSCQDCLNRGCIAEGSQKCSTHFVWRGLTQKIEEYFTSISLSQIVNQLPPENPKRTTSV